MAKRAPTKCSRCGDLLRVEDETRTIQTADGPKEIRIQSRICEKRVPEVEDHEYHDVWDMSPDGKWVNGARAAAGN